MHIMYVDESGDDGFRRDNDYATNNTPTRYFIRTGLIISDKKWKSINKIIQEKKDYYHIPDETELHAVEILRGKKKTRSGSIDNWYKHNFPNKSDRIEIIKEFCTLIKTLDLCLVTVIIDKQLINQSNPNYNFLPKERSWEFLIERYNYHLRNDRDHKGIIISDAVENNIEKTHREFAKGIITKSTHVTGGYFIESILFEPSESSNLLQLVDLASYAIQKRYNRGDDTFITAFEDQFLCKGDCIQGYGLKVWPQDSST